MFARMVMPDSKENDQISDQKDVQPGPQAESIWGEKSKASENGWGRGRSPGNSPTRKIPATPPVNRHSLLMLRKKATGMPSRPQPSQKNLSHSEQYIYIKQTSPG